MKWKVIITLFPRVSKRSSLRTPAYFPVPPVMAFTPLGGSSESLGKAFCRPAGCMYTCSCPSPVNRSISSTKLAVR